MRILALPALLGSIVLMPAPAAAATLSPPVKKDLQCFMLYAVGVAQANKANDEKTQQAAGLGLTYFLGKLKIEAPNLSLASSIREEADAFMADPKAKAIGQSCDDEFQKAGAELRTLGEDLTGKPAATPPK